MEETSDAVSGTFEGYLKKRKTVAGFTLFSEWTKRYFILELESFTMQYFKNRKKKGNASIVPLRELIWVLKDEPDEGTTKIGKSSEWGYEFRVVTRSRTYLFNAYSDNDREVWYRAFNKLMDYK